MVAQQMFQDVPVLVCCPFQSKQSYARALTVAEHSRENPLSTMLQPLQALHVSAFADITSHRCACICKE